MSVLLIDAGNTRIKFAVFANPAPQQALRMAQAQWQGACDTQASAEHIATVLQAHRLSRVIGVCVAGEAVRQRIQAALLPVLPIRVQWLDGATPLPGLRNGYAAPHTLGADRWLAAYGLAQNSRPAPARQPIVLATFGTATTVDVLVWDAASSDCVFEGGIICAGLSSAWRSVSLSTAQLPDVGLDASQDKRTTAPSANLAGTLAIPNNTHAALTLGAIYAQVGAVAQVLERVRRLHGEPNLCLSGGALPQLAAYLPPASVIETPVLLGLLHAATVLK